MDVSLFLHSMAGLFAIMNPFVALPMFLALTDGAAIREQRRAALRNSVPARRPGALTPALAISYIREYSHLRDF